MPAFAALSRYTPFVLALLLTVAWADRVQAADGPERSAVERTIYRAIEHVALAVEVVGIGVIVIGAAVSTGRFLSAGARRRAFDDAYHRYRSDLGRSILLGLEFLVAADIVATVIIDPTLERLKALAIVVAIRTFLSFSLDVEIDGHWPWQKSKFEHNSHREKPD